MPQVIYPLEKTPDDPLIVGGKAASLGRLLRSGLPVPPGFVLSVDAFRAYLKQNKTEDAIPSFLTKDAGAAEAGLLARMRAGRWPGELRSAVEEAYGELAKGGRASVAVRSSAAADDSAGASFEPSVMVTRQMRSRSLVSGVIVSVVSPITSTTWRKLPRPSYANDLRAVIVPNSSVCASTSRYSESKR